MAANEHKNLSSINRHNPKDFETATNDTILSKTIGTSATGTDGSLEWKGKAFMGVTNYKMQGFVASGTTNYKYGEDIADTKSPFEMAVDYGSSTVGGATLTPTAIFRVGQGIIIPENATVTSITGWITSNGGYVVTVAICKVTPAAGVTTALAPVIIDEITATGLSSNDKLVSLVTGDLTSSALVAGDIIFPMIKEATAGSSIYMNLTIQTTTF